MLSTQITQSTTQTTQSTTQSAHGKKLSDVEKAKQYDYEEIAEFIEVSVDFVKEVEKEMEARVHDITYER